MTKGSKLTAPGILRIGSALAAAAGASGCANVYHSRDLTKGELDSQGIVYALPTTWLEISATVVERDKEKGGPYQRITVAERVLPDASHVYSLDHATSAFATDDLTIEVGADQLLDKVYTTTEDATDDIILALTKSVAGIATFSVPGPSGRNKDITASNQGCKAPPAGAWTYAIDPYDYATWPGDWLNPQCVTLAPIASSARNFTETKNSEDCAKGICHRAPVPTRVSFDFGPAGRYELIAGLLNKAPVLSIDIDRAMFVEKTMNLTFDKGVISKLEITRPSPALAAASLPLDVVKALLSAPAEIFKLRVDYSTSAASDAKAEKALLEAREALAAYLSEMRAKDANEQ